MGKKYERSPATIKKKSTSTAAQHPQMCHILFDYLLKPSVRLVGSLQRDFLPTAWCKRGGTVATRLCGDIQGNAKEMGRSQTGFVSDSGLCGHVVFLSLILGRKKHNYRLMTPPPSLSLCFVTGIQMLLSDAILNDGFNFIEYNVPFAALLNSFDFIRHTAQLLVNTNGWSANHVMSATQCI